MAVVTAGSETSVVIKGKAYSLSVAPSYDDVVVQDEVKTVLGELALDDITANLDIAVELLFVAYHGVAAAKDRTVRAEIAELQSALALVCNDCVLTMTVFERQTKDIIGELLGTYKWLTKPQEALAIKTLEHCGEASKLMSDAAKALANRFTELQVNATKARSKAISEETDEQNRKEAAEKAERDLRAKQEAEKKNQEELLAQIGDMQQLYDEAKAREQTESTKALALGITAAIANAAAAGLGAYAAARNPVGSVMAAANTGGSGSATSAKLDKAQKDVDEKKKQADEDQTKVLKAKDTQASAKAKVDQLQKGVDELNKTIGTKEQETSPKEDELKKLKQERDAKQAKLPAAKKALSDEGEKVKSLETAASESTAAYAAAGKALQDLAKQTGQMAAAAATAEESIHAEKMQYLQTKLDLEKQKRASLVALTTYAESIKNAQAEEGSATLSVNSLHAAVDTLGKVVGTLTNASLFWDQMAKYCMQMATQGFQRTVKDLTTAMSPEDRVKEYKEEWFMREFFGYLVQWVAVNGLSGAYVKSAAEAQKKAVKYLGESPTIEEAIKKAPELAKNLSTLIDNDLRASRNASAELERQKALLTA